MHALNIIDVTSSEQVDIVATLAREIWLQHYPPITGLEQTLYMLENYQSAAAISRQLAQGYLYYLLSIANENIGYFALIETPVHRQVQLSKIYIKQEQRKSGYGSQVLAFAKNICRTRTAEQLWLTVNRQNLQSINFYQKSGFVVAGDMWQDIGAGFVMDDYKMVMHLNT